MKKFKQYLVKGLAVTLAMSALVSPLTTFAASAYSASPAAQQVFQTSDQTYMPTAQTADFKIKLNGSEIYLGVDILVLDNRTYLPLRALSNAIQADEVNWDGEYKTAQVVRGGTEIEVVRGSEQAVKNKQLADKLDQKMFINESGSSYLPLRAISSLFEGVTVDWEASTKTVLITTTTGGGTVTPPPTWRRHIRPRNNSTKPISKHHLPPGI